MTLELLQFIRDNTIHLQGHQYQIIQVIEKTWSMAVNKSMFYLLRDNASVVDGMMKVETNTEWTNEYITDWISE